ncbi:Hemerythrin HHE cation binding domain protein [Dehalogenimonas lykanthroporepellens BL-DC-9]|nr:Hemerythrin HHE cation binding domain protein [Dehalogenimonas lykanthroporepellens BL-DC-9]
MKATDQLKEEHRAIEELLATLGRMTPKLATEEAVASEDLNAVVDFIRIFADRCHHGKEESLLFPAMEEAGVPRENGPVGVLLAEHQQGREFVSRLAEGISAYVAGDRTAAEIIRVSAEGYAALLTQHIQKEDNVLFPMAEQALPPARQQRLLEEFEELEERVIGLGKHQELHRTLERLAEKYN